ncbi:MAG: cysteine desulfurase family protein, partial [Anaerolineales bacterium]
MKMPIYLDYAATTPLDERVAAVMEPFQSNTFGNPSSVHRYGQRAEAAVEAAREQVSSLLGCASQEIVFTSCGSESDNLALRGTAAAHRAATGHSRIVTSHAEHHAISKTAEQLEEYYGSTVDWLTVDEHGQVQPDSVAALLSSDTAVVSVMYANNEIGTINPIPEIGKMCRGAGVPFHTDAVQAAAYFPLDVDTLGVDLLSLGGHKFHGPKGVGALYVRHGTRVVPSQTGGGQEFGFRSGTQNVAYIVGFAEALRLAVEERAVRIQHVQSLRDHIVGRVLESVPYARLTGSPDQRLPNHASFAFRSADGNLLLGLLDAAGFACSSGSACKTGSPEPSEVMAEIGLSREWGLGSLRVTVGKDTMPDD